MNSPRRLASPDGDDLFNTSTAHVHIGPLNSPEKRFVLNLLKTNSPRRPLRLSSPSLPHIPLEDLQQSGDDERPYTPENDRLVDDDEPSSVLASRIMHAHDNPSPPPSPETRGADVPFVDDFPDSLSRHTPKLTISPLLHFHRTSEQPDLDPFSSPSPLSPLSDEQEVENLLSASSNERKSPAEEISTDSAGVRVRERPAIDVAHSEIGSSTPRRSDRYRRSPTRVPVELTAAAQVKRVSGSSLPKQKLSSPTRDKSINEAALSQKKSVVRKQTESARRMLDSLSPSSSNLLSQLIPSFGDANGQELSRTPTRQAPEFVSPSKLNALTPKESDMSPRRITVDEAVAQGQLSPQRAAQIKAKNTVTASQTQTPIFNIPRNDSPARRVTVAPGLYSQQKWSNRPRFGSPVRRNERSRSAEPVSTSSSVFKSKSKQRSGSAEPANHSISSTPKLSQTKSKQLPFPILAKSSVPPPIPEENEQEPTEATPLVRSERIKSGLKHPTSRIPRMQKPYTRPAAPKPSTPVKKMVFVNITKAPRTTVNRTKFKDDTNPFSTPGAGPSTARIEASDSVCEPSQQSKDLPKPPQKPPIALGVENPQDPRENTGHKLSMDPSLTLETSSFSTPGTGQSTARVGASKPPPQQVQLSKPLKPPRELAVTLDAENPLGAHEGPTHKPAMDPSLTLETPLLEAQVSLPSPAALSSTVPEVAGILESTRRSARSRKTTSSTSSATTESRTIRKRAQTNVQNDISSLSNMTAVALRALTTLNTTKNQKYMAASLQTKIVRKDGQRPESPVMKVKTVAQRKEDNKGQQRRERAERRAKRASGTVDEIGTDDFSEGPESSPLGGHKRGPGEDEDYSNPACPSKRPRLDEAADDENGKKRVKWDHGLSTSIYLDELELRLQTRPKENAVIKGCLAPTAKALRLDTLGNLHNADSPLKDLVQENIEVTKVVYDDDVEALAETKTTRTRSKKGKS